ncbi:MAG: hypothetical protein IKC10_07470 [Alphaproteobacteria bacterium]|nr:hypothetical protein [Alphaproteobacteria bacterium]
MADIITKEQREWLIEKGYYNPDDKTMNLKKLFAKHKGEWLKEQQLETVTGDDIEVEILDKSESSVYEKVEPDKEEKRDRSANSDTNEAFLDRVRLNAMLDLGHISQDIYDKGISNPSEAIAVINSKMPLKESQMADFETKMVEIAVDKQKLEFMPASMLAKAYTLLKEQSKDDSNEVAKKYLQDVTKRIDSLIGQAANKEGLYYGDVTNIADTYEGYMDMMGVREPDLDADSSVKKQIPTAKAYLEQEVGKYDSLMNIDGKDLDAVELYERFERIEKGLKKVELTPEQIKMYENVRFFDQIKEPEAQFIDKDGKDCLGYSEGCSIKEGSKLDTFIKAAKAQIIQEELGSDASLEDICTPERLEEQLSSIIYSAAAVSKAKEIGENIDEFTKDGKLDKEKMNKFVSNLGTDGLVIDNDVYEKTLDGVVNASGAYAHRLGSKIGKDKAVVMKVFDSVKDVDVRAEDRLEINNTKRKARIEMLKRTLKSGVSAFAISAGISLAGTALSADAGLTAATGGMNKVAGIALGTALGVGMTLLHIHRWRKNQKAQGKPCGLRAMIKDRHLAPALVTTALGSAALGFAATGNPGVATALGYSAMAVGMSSGAINSAIDAKQMGLSGVEAAVWGIAQAGTALGSGFAGRAVAQGFVNHYNQAHPENRIFQHEETRTTTTTVERTVVDVDKINADSDSFLRRTWFKGDQATLDALIEQHGSAEAVQYKIGAGAIEVPALSEYNNITKPVILTESWAQQNGIDPSIIDVVKNYPASSPEFQSAMDMLRPHYEHAQNYVSTIDNAPLRPDLYGHRDPASTYSANGDVPMKTQTENVTVSETILVPNKFVGGLGMLGHIGRVFGKRLKERAGALLDGVKSVFKKQPEPKPEPKQEQEPKPEPKKEPKEVISKELLDEYKIVYGTDLYDFAKGEFIGRDEKEKNDMKKRYNEYYGMVEAELMADDKRKDIGMTAYLRLRKYEFDKIMCDIPKESSYLDPKGEKQKEYLDKIKTEGNDVRVWADDTKKTREAWQQSNLSLDNKKKLTLSHFTKYLTHVKAKDEYVSDGSRNPDLNIDFKNHPKKIYVVSTDKLLFGNEKEEVGKYVTFKGDESYLQKELAVRVALDDLNGVKHNPKTNEVRKRVENGEKNKGTAIPKNQSRGM